MQQAKINISETTTKLNFCPICHHFVLPSAAFPNSQEKSRMSKKWFSWTPKERGDDDEQERGTCELGFEEDEREEQGREVPHNYGLRMEETRRPQN
jgi:hypothetical protein